MLAVPPTPAVAFGGRPIAFLILRTTMLVELIQAPCPLTRLNDGRKPQRVRRVHRSLWFVALVLALLTGPLAAASIQGVKPEEVGFGPAEIEPRLHPVIGGFEHWDAVMPPPASARTTCSATNSEQIPRPR